MPAHVVVVGLGRSYNAWLVEHASRGGYSSHFLLAKLIEEYVREHESCGALIVPAGSVGTHHGISLSSETANKLRRWSGERGLDESALLRAIAEHQIRDRRHEEREMTKK